MAKRNYYPLATAANKKKCLPLTQNNNNKKRSKNNKSPKLCLGDLIRNGAKTISLQTLFGRLNYTIKSTIDAMKYSNTIQLSPFKCNHLYCYIVDKMINVSGNRLKYLMIFNGGIDTMKITALSNHKPGILNTYIRIDIIACKY